MSEQPTNGVQALQNGDLTVTDADSTREDHGQHIAEITATTQEAEPTIPHPPAKAKSTTPPHGHSSFSTATVAAAAAAANTPASLAALLATALTDVDALREELTVTRQRADRAERLLTTFGLVNASMTAEEAKAASNGAEASTAPAPTPLPQATVTLLLGLDERTTSAERERDELAARLAAVTSNWAQLETYMSAVEISLRDARRGYARIVLDGAEPAQAGSSHDYDPVAVSLPGRSIARGRDAFHGMALPPLPGQSKRTRTESMMSMDGYVSGKRPREGDYDGHVYPQSRRGTYPSVGSSYRQFPNQQHLDRQATIPNASPFVTHDHHRSPHRQESHLTQHSRSRSNSAGSEDLETMLLDATGAANGGAKKERSGTLPMPVNPNPGQPFPARNAQGQRLCRQCGLPGRYKDNRCVEKWGPGPMGPGTVCDRCRKRAKRVERRSTGSGVVTGGGGSMDALSIAAVAYAMGSGNENIKESGIRSSLTVATPVAVASRPTSGAPSIVGTPLVGAPGLLPPLRTHSPMHMDADADDGLLDADGDAEAEVDELEQAVVALTGSVATSAKAPAPVAAPAPAEDADADADFDMDLLEAVDAADRAR